MERSYEEQARLNAKQGATVIRRRFALIPTACVNCRKKLWFRFYYGMSLSTAIAHGYGPHPNDHHCLECHNDQVKKKEFCTNCHVGYKDPSKGAL